MLWSSVGANKFKLVAKKGDGTVSQDISFDDRYYITVNRTFQFKSYIEINMFKFKVIKMLQRKPFNGILYIRRWLAIRLEKEEKCGLRGLQKCLETISL